VSVGAAVVPGCANWKRIAAGLFALGLIWSAGATGARAAPAQGGGPPNFVLGVGTPVSISAADRMLRARMTPTSKKTALHLPVRRSLTALSTSAVTCGTSTTLPVEISTLAASLKCDPDLIFEYVYNNIEYEPLFGSNKGPLGTLLDQRGDDSDQAQLFGALLSAAGFSSSQVSYIYGYIRVTGAQAVGWLGVKNDAVAIQNLIANGGTPINAMVPNTGGTLNYIDIAHVWVKVTIGGTDYVFDPSFKQHTINTGLSTSLATVMGYTQSQFLTDAGGTIDSVSIRSVNRAAARTDLNTYAQNIINYIMGHNPAATVNDIVGGKVIQPVTGSPLRNTALSYISPTQPSGYPANWGSSVPNAYRTCFSISMPTVTPTSCTSPSSSTIALYTDQTYGHRITVFSVPSGSNYIPTLLIDGAAPPNGTNTGPATAGGANWAVNVQITHPYASTALANANQTGVLNMAAGGNYLISSGWGQVGRGMVEKHRQLLSQARAAGAAANSEVVLGESLAIVSYTWLAENASAVRLRDGVAAATTQIHHGLGVTAQGLIQGASGTIGPYIDTPLNYISIQPQTAYTGSCIAPTVLGSFFGTWGTASSMEAAVLEQTQALTTGMIAASTIRLVDNNAATGARTYFADGTTSGGLSAYFSTIRPNLTATYALPDIAKIDNAISSNGTSSGSPTGNQAMIPINGAQTVGSYWSGAGYGITAQACPTGMPYTLSAIQWITGALNGGSTGVNVPTTGGAGTPIISSNSQTLTTPPSADALIPAAALAAAHSTSNPLVGNPVDGVSGGYVYSHTDLTTGGGGFPYALSFSREYSSSSYTSDSGLGNGWSHNFTMGASLTSDPYIGLGDRAPIATAPVGSSLAGAGESSAIAAAQAIAATYVSQDLLSGSQSAQNMTISSISERWLTDQLTNNAVMASAPTSSGEFTWLPHADGAASISYAPPAGGAGTLTGTTPDAYGNPTVFTYVGKDQSRVAYSAIGSAGNGQIASWTTPYGMSLTYSYDSSSRLTQVSNTLGRSINLTYSGAHVASVSDDTGRSVSYSYSAAGDMVAASDPLGAVTTFAYDRTGTYDSNGHLTQVYYPSGRGAAFVTNWYDALGRVAQQADANNNRITFYVAGTRTEAVNPAGARQVSYQTPRGMITMQAAVLDNTLGNVFSDTATGAKVNVVTNQYDGADRLVLATAPEGGTTGYAYSPDLMQNVVSVTATPKTGSGLSPLTTTTTYDALYNKPVTVTDPRGLVSAMTYDPSTGNLLKTVADVGGSGHFNVTSRFTYNGVGQMVMGTDPKGVKTLAVYDAQGNLASITSDYGGANITATATYSPLGDVLTATDPEGNTTKLVYDAARRLSTVTLPSTGGSAAPVMTAFTYNADGELLTTTQSAGGVVLSTVNTTYTATGNVATASDPKGNVVRYSYDNVDRVSSVMDPVGNITSVGYDALSRATASYNTAIQSSPLVRQAYTADGLTASQTVARSNSVADTTAYGYDGLDRPSTVTFPDASTEAYSYDADSNVLARKTRAGATIGFSYDTLNRLIAKTPPSSPVVSYAYDITGNIVGVSDTSASIASPSASASFSQSATYDALNRPISLSWTPAATQTTPTATSATFTYGYDANNRRTSQAASDNSWLGYPAASAAVTSYTANSLNQYSAVGAVTPTYDGNGALTYDGQYTYAYNVESRLLSVKIGASTVATYAYDAQLRRKSKTVGASITVYVTDEADNGVLDYDGATGAVLHWYPAGSQVDVGAGTRSTFITDIQGSVIGMLSSSGTLTKFGYQPFGENPNLTTDGYRYTGQQLDAETAGSTAEPSGLYYLRARTYSPTWGRFLQPDPAKSTTNLYAYASNDPLNLSDPSGLANCDGSPSSSNDPDPAGALSSVTALSYCPAEWKTLLDAQRELLALYDSQHSPNVAVPINPAPTPTPTPTPAPTPTPKPTPVDEVTVVATRRQAYIPATPVQVLQLSIYVPNIQVSLSGSVSAAKQTPVWCKAEKSSKQLSSTGVVLAVTGVVAAEIPPLAAILEFGAAAADVGSVYYGVVAGVQKGRATGDYSSLGAAVAGFFVSRAAGMKPAPSAIAGKTGEGVSSIGDTSCEVK
jgi:RHS repeat-associated protein